MTALILGCGVSGKAAEKYLQSKGFNTVIYDDNPPPLALPPEFLSTSAGATFGSFTRHTQRTPRFAGQGTGCRCKHFQTHLHAFAQIGGQFDFCVVSPGISYGHRVVQRMLERDIPVIAEFELPFFLSNIKAKIVAVTGTNGKTTVVTQIHNALVGSGKKSVLCGNIGVPISADTDKLHGAVGVVEISSFMLEPAAKRIKHSMPFRPHIAVITNITQDHLERHGTMDEYQRCKEQIFSNQRRKDWLILNYDDPRCRSIGQTVIDRKKRAERKTGVPRVLWFSGKSRIRGFYCDGGIVYRNTGRKAKPFFALTEVNENTPHGIANLLAAVCAGYLLKLKRAALKAAVTAVNRPNRIESAGEKNGIAFYNDSKATNTASVLAACGCFSLPVVLIMCGLAKGQNYDELFEKLPKNVTDIIVFGECTAAVAKSAETANYANITAVDDLQTAVSAAVGKSAAPNVILFSPGGSSFDMFENYKDRGEQFRKCVQKFL
jgi:UDP-N-acetylmuramoylalanine--D-glutamate ligase